MVLAVWERVLFNNDWLVFPPSGSPDSPSSVGDGSPPFTEDLAIYDFPFRYSDVLDDFTVGRTIGDRSRIVPAWVLALCVSLEPYTSGWAALEATRWAARFPNPHEMAAALVYAFTAQVMQRLLRADYGAHARVGLLRSTMKELGGAQGFASPDEARLR